MKQPIFKFMLFLALISGGITFGGKALADSNKAVASAQFRSQLDKVVSEYLSLKDALVGSDSVQAALQAGKLNAALEEVDGKVLDESGRKSWDQQAAVIKEKSAEIKASPGLKAQRVAFSALSDAVEQSARQFGPLSVTLYHDFCPMAFNNKGAYWLSSSKEIMNPYFGKMMLHCGEVKETIGESK